MNINETIYHMEGELEFLDVAWKEVAIKKDVNERPLASIIHKAKQTLERLIHYYQEKGMVSDALVINLKSDLKAIRTLWNRIPLNDYEQAVITYLNHLDIQINIIQED